MFETPEFARMRVKLFKSGKFSHSDIDAIFSCINSPEDLHNMALVARKCEELVLMPKNRKYLGLIDKICEFMVANEDQEIVKIIAKKDKKGWTFIVG